MDHETAAAVSDRILDAVGGAVIAGDPFLETMMTGILARGHVLLEDVPGTGKTLTAQTFANALNLEFRRIQFTPDLLPSDITGSNIYNEASGEFEFSRGPVFANVVLADEINRAPPKTQAALLEAMAERQVTVDGHTYELPTPFFVIATQNPVEQEGTFGLPEAQRDRFIIKTEIGYPGAAGERELLDRRADRTTQTPSIDPVLDDEDVPKLQAVPETVTVEGQLRDYMIELGRETRGDRRVEVGVSPRGIQRLFEASRARAVLSGRDYVVPDDIKRVVEPVFTHRLVLTADAGVRGIQRSEVISDILAQVEVPAVGATGQTTQRGRQQPRGHPGQQGTPPQQPPARNDQQGRPPQQPPDEATQQGASSQQPPEQRRPPQQPPSDQQRRGRSQPQRDNEQEGGGPRQPPADRDEGGDREERDRGDSQDERNGTGTTLRTRCADQHSSESGDQQNESGEDAHERGRRLRWFRERVFGEHGL